MFLYVLMSTSGNLLVVPIIKLIGMTMALTVWGIFNMLSGWLQGMSVDIIMLPKYTSSFFYSVLLEQHPMCHAFNYSGVAAIVLGLVLVVVFSECLELWISTGPLCLGLSHQKERRRKIIPKREQMRLNHC